MNTEAGARRNEQRFLDPATLARLGSLGSRHAPLSKGSCRGFIAVLSKGSASSSPNIGMPAWG